MKYRDIVDSFIHSFDCKSCGKNLKVRIKKINLPNNNNGLYTHYFKIICNECNTLNNSHTRIWYPIKRKKYGYTPKYNSCKKDFFKKYAHRIKVHCSRSCYNFEHMKDCKNTGCEFYGVLKAHKQIPKDEELWWCHNKMKVVEKYHDEYYKSKCKKKTNDELKDSSTIPNIDSSSEN